MDLAETEHSAWQQNPVDTFEDVAAQQNWLFERNGDEQLLITINGNWCDYVLSVVWSPLQTTLEVSATCDIKVAPGREQDIFSLLALINKRMALGHFNLWAEEGGIVFRTAMPLSRSQLVFAEQCEILAHVVIEACERYYPAFQFVLWAGKKPQEALDASLFDTIGNA